MREQEFRAKITRITFLFSIFVIWVHSYNVDLFSRGDLSPSWESAARIEKFFSISLGQAAVPGFFMISSYLFFRSYQPEKLLGKWKSRINSIVIPYVVWNILYYLGYVTASRLPFVDKVVGKNPIPFSATELWEAVFHYKYAPIFWYLYQLIILLILAPVIWYLIRNRYVGICYLAILLLMVHLHMDCAHPNTDALFYFSSAAFLAVHGKKLAEEPGNVRRTGAGILLFAVAAGLYVLSTKPGSDVVMTVLYRFLVPQAVWLMVPERLEKDIPAYMKQSLFLYAIHFIFVRFINKGAAMAGLSGSASAALLVYFAIPVLVVIFSYITARGLSRYAPAVFRILSGGRSLDA